jgi:hypothetical protein
MEHKETMYAAVGEWVVVFFANKESLENWLKDHPDFEGYSGQPHFYDQGGELEI